MSHYNKVKNTSFDIPRSTLELLSGLRKGDIVAAATSAALEDAQYLADAIRARQRAALPIAQSMRITTTVPATVSDDVQTLSDITGLSRNMVVSLALETYLTLRDCPRP